MPSTMLHQRLNLTAAQLAALNATPVTIVEAPGVGHYLLPHWAELTLNQGPEPLTPATTTTVTLRWVGRTEALVDLHLYGQVNAAGLARVVDNVVYGVTSIAEADIDNLALELSSSASIDSAQGTATVDVWWTVHPVP